MIINKIDNFQEQLSQKWIFPNIKDLSKYLYKIREDFDLSVSLYLKSDRKNDLIFSGIELKNTFKCYIKKYPLGCCYHINDLVFKFIKQDKERPQYLTNFIKEGGIVKKIWGQIKNIYFQSAMQFGAYYVDVSNDTVDITKHKIEILLFSESQFKNIDSLLQYSKIKESYHNVKVYPNIYYPEISYAIPLFYVS